MSGSNYLATLGHSHLLGHSVARDPEPYGIPILGGLAGRRCAGFMAEETCGNGRSREVEGNVDGDIELEGRLWWKVVNW